MSKTAFVGFVLAAALASRSASAQIVDSRVVLASVTDSNNRALVDVGPDDFVIEEEGEERDVLNVYVADYPIVIMLDNSSNAERDIQALREAAAGFVRRIGHRPVALATLSDPPQILGSFADAQADVLNRISELAIGSTAVHRPVDAVAMAVHTIQTTTNAPFSAIVIVSAGKTTAAEPESTDLLRSIFSSGTIVYAITRGERLAAPSGRGSRPGLEGGLLRDLVDQTGGRFTTVFSAGSYSVALDQVADRLATEMMIQYLVPSDSDAGPEVRIGVRVPGARIYGLGVTQRVSR